MHHPLSRKLSPLIALLIGLWLATASSVAQARSKDKAALSLYDDAIEEDYLNTDFDAAIKKLKKAVKKCGRKGCSDKVLAKLYVGLGIVYGEGKKSQGKAKSYFVKAFETYQNARPVEDYMTAGLTKLFKAAKSEASGDGGDDDDDSGSAGDDDDDDSGGGSSGSDVDYSPPSEALVNTPLPIFVEVPEDVGAKALSLRYKPFGGTKWQSLKMRRMASGFGGAIPCSDLTTTGELKLYLIIKDEQGDPIATAGSRRSPLAVKIRSKIDGDQPALPGKEPPEQCVEKGDCPPDFPGCTAAGKGRGDKGWGASCDSTKECRQGLVCLNGSCEQGEGDDDDDDDDGGGGGAGGGVKNFVTLGLQLDTMIINGAENVCGSVRSDGSFSQELDNYFCFRGDGEYLGKPVKGKFNQVQGGFGIAGARVLAGFDRLLWKGLGAGVRVGWAFGGSPSAGDADSRFEACKANPAASGCRGPLASDFKAYHLEARAEYLFMQEGLIRPYAFIGGGAAQVNAGVTVAVCDTVNADGTPVNQAGDGRCPDNSKKRDDIDAYQITGLGFIDFGGGAIFAFHKHWGVNVEVKMMAMLPTFGFVIAPSAAPVFMF